MKRLIIFIFILLLQISKSEGVFGQTTITISDGPKFTDVLISYNAGNSSTANTNYNVYPRISASAWTSSGNLTYARTLLKFDLSEIPTDATVSSAFLYLNSDPTHTSNSDWAANSTLSGSNAIYFQKITQTWDSTSVTWNTQPTVTDTDEVWVPQSTSTTENIQVDLTSFVQHWVQNPDQNYGMMMIFETEAYYRARNYVSKDHSNANLHPRLVVIYQGGTFATCGWQTDTAGNLYLPNGSVSIGTDTTFNGYNLLVNGNILSEEVVVKLSQNWPDYVFDKGYPLMNLDDVYKYAETKKHLPGIPSGYEIEKNGLDLGDMQKNIMLKIEEYTLYLSQLKTENDKLVKERQTIQNDINNLKHE